jgi:hypothetical protein
MIGFINVSLFHDRKLIVVVPEAEPPELLQPTSGIRRALVTAAAIAVFTTFPTLIFFSFESGL